MLAGIGGGGAVEALPTPVNQGNGIDLLGDIGNTGGYLEI